MMYIKNDTLRVFLKPSILRRCGFFDILSTFKLVSGDMIFPGNLDLRLQADTSKISRFILFLKISLGLESMNSPIFEFPNNNVCKISD